MTHIKELVTLLLLLLILPLHIFAKQGDEKVVFSPQWTPQSQFAGYYAAAELGYYEQLGLDVEIKHPTSSMQAIEMLKGGASDIITSMLVDAISSCDDGFNMVNIMQLMPRSSMVIVSHIPLNKDISVLDGKTIATWKAGFSTIIVAILKEKGMNIEWVKFLAGVNVFLSGSVEAATAMSYNELQTIKETGYIVKDGYNTIKLSDLGYNIPEDGMYTTPAYAKKNPETVQKFREASIKGWRWVAENREEAIDIVLKVAEKNNIPTNRYHQTKMLDAILDMGVASESERFNLKQFDYIQTRELLFRNELIKKRASFDSFVVKAAK